MAKFVVTSKAVNDMRFMTSLRLSIAVSSKGKRMKLNQNTLKENSINILPSVASAGNLEMERSRSAVWSRLRR